MTIKVLGASGSEVPSHNLPAFLIDNDVLLDAGTIGLSLDDSGQWKIKHILLTHAHLDHIKGIPFLLDNIIIKNRKHTVTVISGKEVLADLKDNVLNNRIWPDFTRIPNAHNPALKFRAISPARSMRINSYRIHCEKMNHTVPAYGYIIVNKKGRAIAYTGDTGPTDRFWKKVSAYNISCLIAEVSFPNRLTQLAVQSGHLSPSLLKKELAKINHLPARIFITHAKPQYMKAIQKEIRALGLPNIAILKDNQIITI